MSRLRQMMDAARWRGLADDLLIGLPVVLLPAFIGWLVAGLLVAAIIIALELGVLAGTAVYRTRRFGQGWLIHALNAKRADMDDSADLLFVREDGLNPLQRMQRERLKGRLEASRGPDLRPRWSTRRIAIVWSVAVALGAVITGLILYKPTFSPPTNVTEATKTLAGPPVLVAQSVSVTPPAYTGQAARTETVLDLRAPEGTVIVWKLKFSPQAEAPALVFLDGTRLPLKAVNGEWTARLVLKESVLYRIVASDADAKAPLHRIDAIADLPPQVRVIAPENSLTLVEIGQTQWPLVFEVKDDYGVAGTARLTLTLAQGQGEQITVRDRVVELRATGAGRTRRFSYTVDLAELGVAKGDDLIVRLSVTDNRSPKPQGAESPALILRWPSDLGEAGTGVEGIMRTTLPAYFRSQRQIIIDAEALLKEKRKLSADDYLKRSDSLGVDQRILRLRYGQFLGEEAEGAPKIAGESQSVDGDHHAEGDGHDHGEESAAPAGFGESGDVLELFGHTHDEAEAATLLDPETRAILKLALDEMWQSELYLRQGRPDLALPHAYKALDYIKQVQQSTRVYLAKVGPELPPIDEKRRMTGKREGISSAELGLRPVTGPDAPVVAVWRALAFENMAIADDAPLPLGELDNWLKENGARLANRLDVLAALDAVRADPACLSCRLKLRDVLWQVITRPAAQPARRDPAQATGNRYLDALSAGGQP